MRRKAEEELRISNEELEKRVHCADCRTGRGKPKTYRGDDRTRKDEELKKAYRLTHHILEMPPFGIYIVNDEGYIEYVNQTMLTISGESHSQFIGVNTFELASCEEIDLSELEKTREALDLSY
jgi:PAS domain-containing protein